MKLPAVLVTLAVAFMTVAATTSPLVARTVNSGTVDWAEADPKSSSASGEFIFRPDSKNGLYIYVSASGLDKGAKYPFHIHTNFVPTNGNCTGTGGHFNPNNVDTTSGKYKCNPSDIKGTCELGDLSGIFGGIVGDTYGNFNGKFDATFLSFTGDTSILDRSVVIHNSDGDRIACANITAYVISSDNTDESNSDSESSHESSDTSGATVFTPLISGLLAVAFAAFAF
ncbi:hypothetical protein EV178_002947 [Coemansia sp. RSA 1646]|nr:hypothetical protein EV178_002947 [Coemansia sp. RSA 1646]